MALWPNGKNSPGDVWHEYGPRRPIQTPNGPTSSFHSGIDIGPWNGVNNTWLLSPVDGEVTHAAYDSIFGYRVVVRGEGADFWLCHGRAASMQVKAGQRVKRGQKLQLMGATGKAAGVHIHFEVHVNGKRVDPRAFYAGSAGSIIGGGGNSSGNSGGKTPAQLLEEEDDMKVKFGHRTGEHADEWMIVHPQFEGGYLVTTSEKTAIAWSRLYGIGWDKNESKRYDFNVPRSEYIDIQNVARMAAKAWRS